LAKYPFAITVYTDNRTLPALVRRAVRNMAYFLKWNVAPAIRSLCNPLYYRMSFGIDALNRKAMLNVRHVLEHSSYNPAHIRFVRKSMQYFEMRYQGKNTGYGYFTNTNEID
jgi:hypothetical protein